MKVYCVRVECFKMISQFVISSHPPLPNMTEASIKFLQCGQGSVRLENMKLFTPIKPEHSTQTPTNLTVHFRP